MPYRNTKLSISVGVRGTEVLATTQASDVKPGHGTKALIWGMKWEVEKYYFVVLLHTVDFKNYFGRVQFAKRYWHIFTFLIDKK